ncbi:hypothetical protein ACERGC_11235, partial [Streptococcus thoraltensis]
QVLSVSQFLVLKVNSFDNKMKYQERQNQHLGVIDFVASMQKVSRARKAGRIREFTLFKHCLLQV